MGVYIKSGVPYRRRLDLEIDHIECVWIEICFQHTKEFLVGIMYRPPDCSNHLDKNFNSNLENVLKSIASENKETIIIGDINCNYLKRNDHRE